jgi:hypothetical protein
MTIHKIHKSSGNIIGFNVSGKLSDEDYKNLVIPEIEKAIEKFGEICLLWEMEKFHGWDASAAWDDLKILRKYKKTIMRIAVVGDKDWERWLEKTVKLFTKAEVRYFDHARRQRAWIWLKEQPEAK